LLRPNDDFAGTPAGLHGSAFKDPAVYHQVQATIKGVAAAVINLAVALDVPQVVSCIMDIGSA